MAAKLAELRAAKAAASNPTSTVVVSIPTGVHTAETQAIANEIANVTFPRVTNPTNESISIPIAVTNLQTMAASIPELPVSAASASINTYVLHEAVANLQTLILTAHPTLPVLLRTIHKQLREDAELVTILSEEEVGIIINGLKKVTNTEIAATAVKGSTTAKLKKKGTLNVDMF